MEDPLLREELHGYVRTAEPPLRLDVQQVLAAGRRARRRRRYGLVTAAVAGVTAVALAVSLLPEALGWSTDSKVRPAGLCGTPGKDWGPARELRSERQQESWLLPPEPGDHATRRLTCVLRELLLPTLEPAAKLAPVSQGQAGPAEEVRRVEYDGLPSYELAVVVTDTQGTGLLEARISVTNKNDTERESANCTKLGEALAAQNKGSCEVAKGARGEVILTHTGPDGYPGTERHRVKVFHHNTRVDLLAWNSATSPERGHGPHRPHPPVSVPELLAVATAPELTLFPSP